MIPLPKRSFQKTHCFWQISIIKVRRQHSLDYYLSFTFILPCLSGPVKNETYKENLGKLNNLVLVQFAKDTVVDPKGSEWFSWFNSSDSTTMVPLQQLPLYQEDWLGLKTLDKSGKLHLMSVNGDHLQLDQKSLDDIIQAYLKE